MRRKAEYTLSILTHYQCIWILLNSMCLALVALITSSDVAGLLLSIANLLTVSAVVSMLNCDALSPRLLGVTGVLFALVATALQGTPSDAQPTILGVATLGHAAWILILQVANRRSMLV